MIPTFVWCFLLCLTIVGNWISHKMRRTFLTHVNANSTNACKIQIKSTMSYPSWPLLYVEKFSLRGEWGEEGGRRNGKFLGTFPLDSSSAVRSRWRKFLAPSRWQRVFALLFLPVSSQLSPLISRKLLQKVDICKERKISPPLPSPMGKLLR